MMLEIPDEYFSEEELRRTPERWKQFLNEWLVKSQDFNFTVFPNEDKVDELISETHIPFYSMCSHHALVFEGEAHVGYIPKDKICGISKLARVVDKFACRPQLQERLTQQIANFLMEELDAHGVIVVMEANHLCMEARGVKKAGARTVTSALKGVCKNPETKDEFYKHIELGES